MKDECSKIRITEKKMSVNESGYGEALMEISGIYEVISLSLMVGMMKGNERIKMRGRYTSRVRGREGIDG